MKNIIKLIGIIALAAVIGFTFAACGDDDNGGGGPQKATYVSTDNNGNKYTLEIDESGARSARSAAQAGDTFKLTVEYNAAFGGGSIKMTFEYSGTVGAAQTSGARVSLTLNINGETITITIVGTQMTVITGRIVDDDGEEIVNNPGPVTPVNPGPGPDSGGGGNDYEKLNGVWDRGDIVVTFYNDSAVFTEVKSGHWLIHLNAGRIYIGDSKKFRNITKAGDLRWTAQEQIGTIDNSGLGGWHSCTITVAANGQTLQIVTENADPSITNYTRVNGNYW